MKLQALQLADVFLQINYTVQENCLDIENWQNVLWFLDTNHTVTFLEGWESQQTLFLKDRKKKKKGNESKTSEKSFTYFTISS